MAAPREGFDEHELAPWERPPTRWTAADLMAAEFPEPRWAVPGIIVEGLTLLAGAPKLGKSWLALNLVVATSAGGCAFGRVAVERGEALYLALEDPPRRLKSRLTNVLDGAGAPEGLHFDTEWPLLHDGGADRLDEWLGEHPACRLVVIDVLARVRGTTRDKDDKYEADYRSMVRLKQIADAHRVAIVVIHHTRKAAAEDFLDTVSGTNGLAGAADSILVLARARNGADATLHVTGRDVEEQELALTLVDGRWTLLDGKATDYKLADTRRKIVRLLREHGPMTPKRIAETLGIDHELTKKTCVRMDADDQLVNAGNGLYRDPSVPLSLVSPESPDSSIQSLSTSPRDSRDTGDTPQEAA